MDLYITLSCCTLLQPGWEGRRLWATALAGMLYEKCTRLTTLYCCTCATPASFALDPWHSYPWPSAALGPVATWPCGLLRSICSILKRQTPRFTALWSSPCHLYHLPLSAHNHSSSSPSLPVSLSSALFSSSPSSQSHPSSLLLLPPPLSSSSMARLVLRCEMNSWRHLAWNHPGTGNPASVFSVYEFPACCIMQHGADHWGRSLCAMERVISRKLSYTCTSWSLVNTISPAFVCSTLQLNTAFHLIA